MTQTIARDYYSNNVSNGSHKMLVDNKFWLFAICIVADEKSGATALDKLFNEIGPKMKDRNGGYTRQYKLENRRGDNAPVVLVTWVD